MDPKTEKRLADVRNRLLRSVRTELQRGDISADELLSVLSHTVGQCIAMQDQRKVTPEQALKLVWDNIEAGNKAALSDLLEADGGAH